MRAAPVLSSKVRRLARAASGQCQTSWALGRPLTQAQQPYCCGFQAAESQTLLPQLQGPTPSHCPPEPSPAHSCSVPGPLLGLQHLTVPLSSTCFSPKQPMSPPSCPGSGSQNVSFQTQLCTPIRSFSIKEANWAVSSWACSLTSLILHILLRNMGAH